MNTKQIICLAYRFEIASIELNKAAKNPYYDTIIQLKNGKALWEVVNLMVESYTNQREQYEKLEQFTNQVYTEYDNMKCTIEEQVEEINDLKQQLFEGKDNPLDDLLF